MQTNAEKPQMDNVPSVVIDLLPKANKHRF